MQPLDPNKSKLFSQQLASGAIKTQADVNSSNSNSTVAPPPAKTQLPDNFQQTHDMNNPVNAALWANSYNAQPTMGQAGISGTGLDGYYTDAQNTANTPVDENAIRQQTLDRIQSEINAQNLVYDDMVRKAQQTGKEQLQQAGAIQARRGLLGSDFGSAQNNVVQGGTNESLNSIETQRGAAIQAIRTQAQKDATAEIAAKRAARDAGAQQYLTFLAGKTERNKTSAQNAVKALVYGGHKLDDAATQELAKTYGLDVPTIQAMYGDEQAAQDKANKDNLISPIKVGESLVNPQTGEVIYVSPEDVNKKRYLTLADGASVYDTVTGKVVAENTKNFAPKAGTGTGGIPSPYANDLDAIVGNTLASIPTKFGQAAFQQQVAKARNDSDKINLIATQVLKGQPAEFKVDFANQAVGISQLDKAINLLDTGVKTGAINNALQYTFNLAGKDYDPKLAAINGYLTSAIQPYRNSVTGAAWGTQEDSEYQQLFGSTKYSPAELKQRLLQMKETLKSKSATGLNAFVNPLGTNQNVFETGTYAPVDTTQPQSMSLPDGTIVHLQADGTYS